MIHATLERYDVARGMGGVSMALITDEGERIIIDMAPEDARSLGLALDLYGRPDDDELLSVPEAAEAIGITYRALHQRTTMPPPDVEVTEGRKGRRLRFWWRSTLDRAGVIERGNRREAGEGDVMSLFWAFVLFSVLAKGCGFG